MVKFWLLCICVIIYSSYAESSCTITVTYNQDGRKEKLADCSKRGLLKIPEDLPPDINVLDLSDNQIQGIQNHSFVNYKQLAKININNNKISKIDKNGFNTLGQLEDLSMADNSLNLSSVYTEELFKPLLNIKHLDIRRNMKQPTTVNYPDLAFSTLTKLTYLALDMASNPVFGYGFRKLQNLSSLKFDTCFLMHLRHNTFENFSLSVEHLSLVNCKLHFVTMDIGALSPFNNLIDIDFSHSCIHLIQALNLLYPFKGKTMRSLIFSGLNCPIFNSKVYPYVLTVTPLMVRYLQTICVQTLDISYNGIVDFEPGSLLTYERPECLQHFILKGNRFTFTYGTQFNELQSFFHHSVNLKTFDYSEIPVAFEQTSKNNLNYNLLQPNNDNSNSVLVLPQSIESLSFNHVICYDYPKAIVVSAGSNLTFLDVSFGDNLYIFVVQPSTEIKIRTLIIQGRQYDVALQQMLHMPNLSLTNLTWKNAHLYSLIYELHRGNEIETKLIQKLWKHLKFLLSLDISENSLWTLTDNIFASMKNLSALNLSNNLFQSIPDSVMTLTKLTELDVQKNLLITLKSDVCKWADEMHLKQGFVLKMINNAFECTCNNIDFIKWIYETEVNLDSRAYSCSLSNGTVIDTEIAYNRMHELFADCNRISWLKVGISMLFTVFVLILLIILYNKRWQICLIFYKKIKFFVERKIERYYIYDVYISYGYDGLPWIKSTLLPILEGQWNLKLCLRDRDFLLGGSYTDDEAESIEKSRHVIFLITPTFRTSHDCLFEIDRVKYEKRMRTIENIIVIAKDISILDVPTELTYIWNYVTFIQWSIETKDLDVMWQKLKMWIVYNERTNPKI